MEFKRIREVFESRYLAVPDYQRDYEWGSYENNTLFDDIVSMMDEENEIHFIGAIVTVPFERENANSCFLDFEAYKIDTGVNSNIRHIVDGQQRLTSLSIFLCALLDSIKNDLSEEEREVLTDSINRILKGSDRNSNHQQAPSLLLNGNTGKCYYSGILQACSKNYDGTYSGAKHIKAAYNLFYKAIAEEKANHIEKTKKDFYWSLYEVIDKKVRLVEIQCDDSTNAFQVFDSLNGKGMDLTASDRIKNILLSWSPAQSNKIQKWEKMVEVVGAENMTSFFASLLFVQKGTRVSKSKLPDEFRKLYIFDAKNNFDSFVENLISYSKIYGQLLNRKTTQETLNDYLNDLYPLSKQAFGFIFGVVVLFNVSLENNDPNFISFIKQLISLSVRFQVYGYGTNKLDSFFSDCISNIKKENGNPDKINNLAELSEKIKKFKIEKVDDEAFKNAFKDFAPTDSTVCEFYLRSLENYLRVEKGNRQKVQRSLTIEHIIPQTMTNEELSNWFGEEKIPDEVSGDRKGVLIERIGNKALLFRDDNSSASNNSYSEKIDVYKNGKRGQLEGKPYDTFLLIKNLVDTFPTHFAYKEVKARAEFLAELALKIW